MGLVAIAFVCIALTYSAMYIIKSTCQVKCGLGLI